MRQIQCQAASPKMLEFNFRAEIVTVTTPRVDTRCYLAVGCAQIRNPAVLQL